MGVEGMENFMLGKSLRKGSEVGHNPAILNDSEETGCIGERRNIISWLVGLSPRCLPPYPVSPFPIVIEV